MLNPIEAPHGIGIPVRRKGHHTLRKVPLIMTTMCRWKGYPRQDSRYRLTSKLENAFRDSPPKLGTLSRHLTMITLVQIHICSADHSQFWICACAGSLVIMIIIREVAFFLQSTLCLDSFQSLCS